MIRDDAYLVAPWNVPVTVCPGQFVPHRKELEPFNIQTEIGGMGPYGVRKHLVPADTLLYADLQTTPDYLIPGRLGSGRSGFYRGRYLKGVGRTPLAANWNAPADRMHATGHLSISGAVREQVVTWYLTAKGLATRINGCEGLLVAPLAPALRENLPAPQGGAHPCDRAMQAISVKRATFARFSNFLWLMHNMDHAVSHEALVRFFVLFVRYLDPEAPLALNELTPTRIARTFSDTVERTVHHFRDFWRAGVVWMFPQNNMAMDGRFHDLDSPTFVGGPFLGAVVNAAEDLRLGGTDPMRIVGLTVLAYVHHVRTFYRLLRGRLELLPTLDFAYSATEREFMREVVSALDEEFSGEHVLFNVDQLAAMIFGWLNEECVFDPAESKRVEELVVHCCRQRMALRTVAPRYELELRNVDVTWARPGQRTVHKTITAFACSTIRPEHLEEARFINELLSGLDAISDRDALFSALDEARGRIAARISPLVPSGFGGAAQS